MPMLLEFQKVDLNEFMNISKFENSLGSHLISNNGDKN